MHIDGQKVSLVADELARDWQFDFEAWDIDPGRGLMRHRVNGMIFEIRRNGLVSSFEDYYARLIHLDDGQPVREKAQIIKLATEALILYVADLGLLSFNFKNDEPSAHISSPPEPYVN